MHLCVNFVLAVENHWLQISDHEKREESEIESITMITLLINSFHAVAVDT